MVAATVDPARLVFVEEMGTNSSLSAIYAYSPRGHRAYAGIPRNRGLNTTLLSSMAVEGVGPSLAVVGATTQVTFDFYVEQVLAPTLESGQIVVLDNLAAHKSLRAKELIEARGCELMYLPPSEAPPNLNPIEEAFSKTKGTLRRVEARTRETLIEALGAAISAVTLSDARSFFEHSGYRLPVHFL